MAKRLPPPAPRLTPAVAAVVRTVESRFADIEALLLEMRGEQDRHLRQLTALRVEMDLVTVHVRAAELRDVPDAPARHGRARRKANR